MAQFNTFKPIVQFSGRDRTLAKRMRGKVAAVGLNWKNNILPKAYGPTYETWSASSTPDFVGQFGYSGGDIFVSYSTGSSIYNWVDNGTDSRYVLMDSSFKPKTKPRVMQSTAGGGNRKPRWKFSKKQGPVTESPGIAARGFSKIIMEELKPEFLADIEKAIDEALNGI